LVPGYQVPAGKGVAHEISSTGSTTGSIQVDVGHSNGTVLLYEGTLFLILEYCRAYYQ